MSWVAAYAMKNASTEKSACLVHVQMAHQNTAANGEHALDNLSMGKWGQ